MQREDDLLVCVITSIGGLGFSQNKACSKKRRITIAQPKKDYEVELVIGRHLCSLDFHDNIGELDLENISNGKKGAKAKRVCIAGTFTVCVGAHCLNRRVVVFSTHPSRYEDVRVGRLQW